MFKLFRLSQLSVATLCAVTLSGCLVQPHRVSDTERYHYSAHDLKTIVKGQEPVSQVMTMDEAVARALKYNLEHRIQVAQLALSSGQLLSAQLAMIPGIKGTSTYSFRNSLDQTYLADTNGNPLPPSTSSITPRETTTSDVTLNWNMLDFGLSYLRAKGQADQVLISEEEKRKVVHGIVQQVRMAYWKAFNAQRLLVDVETLRQQVNIALVRAQQVQADRADSQEAQLNYQNGLVANLQQLSAMRLEMYKAREELMNLMSLPSNQQITLAPPQVDMTTLPEINVALPAMDAVALVNRPELREADYKLRMAQQGVTTAVLNSLPGINFSFGYNHSTNQYKVHPDWHNINLAGTWDLMKLVSAKNAIDIAKTNAQLDMLRRMSMTMTVLTQVRMAYLDYENSRETYFLTARKNAIAQNLFVFSQKRQQANAGNEQEVIGRKLAALNSDIEATLAYAKAQESLGNLYSSVGINLLPVGSLHELDLGPLANLVRTQMAYYHSTNQFNYLVYQSYQDIVNDVQVMADGSARVISPFECNHLNNQWACALKSKGQVEREQQDAKEQALLIQELNEEADDLDVIGDAAILDQRKADPFNCQRGMNGQWMCSLVTTQGKTETVNKGA